LIGKKSKRRMKKEITLLKEEQKIKFTRQKEKKKRKRKMEINQRKHK
jgi:hypothetical protein